ncbi:DnaJ-domain-containing protein [Cryphonectria parasitica EP155]|uniref:DnaJ-domain-containing protein n=1 Tax=Cryphonectria parasitica (strain ATCC 38755 / EP155) TaxID=660469 RepID=A0A9P5CS81_CRYP1|nr:DnaJ-domain-containing protein [Cryphonectria parasitica EP155]KAF3768051.1 DnaJ-domain-containing protein [Cryphonectria parasitica EP155]
MASKEDQPVDNRDVTDILDAEGKEWEKDAEIDRILKAFRLDAYAVLGLKPGVPESDIKVLYRKKSLLIHPDKTRNPRAPDAFDRLKKAQTELMDEKHRAVLDEAIADARMLVLRDLKLTVDSPEAKEPDAEFERKWADKTKMVLIDNEQRRRRQLKAQMQEEGREQRKEDAELEERKRKRQHEQDWEATRDQRIGSWRAFQKGKSTGGPDGPSKKKKKMKPIG